MLKIKIKCKSPISEAIDDSGLNKIQKHNLDYLLQKDYSHGAGRYDVTIASNFIEDMANQQFEKTGDPDIFDNIYDETNPVDVMTQIVKQVPSLKSFKIIDAITGASFGKIFKLSNQHILKIFLGGVDVQSDIKWYKKCYDMMQSGKKSTVLPVYGEPGKVDLPNYDIWYVEMAEVIPLDDRMKQTGRGEADTIVSSTKAIFKKLYIEDGIRKFSKIVEGFIDFVFPGKHSQFHDETGEQDEEETQKIIETLRPLTRKEIVALLRVFYDMMQMGFKLSDVAPRNMGVLVQDPDTIVIFDR